MKVACAFFLVCCFERSIIIGSMNFPKSQPQDAEEHVQPPGTRQKILRLVRARWSRALPGRFHAARTIHRRAASVRCRFSRAVPFQHGQMSLLHPPPFPSPHKAGEDGRRRTLLLQFSARGVTALWQRAIVVIRVIFGPDGGPRRRHIFFLNFVGLVAGVLLQVQVQVFLGVLSWEGWGGALGRFSIILVVVL